MLGGHSVLKQMEGSGSTWQQLEVGNHDGGGMLGKNECETQTRAGTKKPGSGLRESGKWRLQGIGAGSENHDSN